jgi:hypothetical protein
MKQHVAGNVKSGNMFKDSARRIPKDETAAELKARLMVEKAKEKEAKKEKDSEVKNAQLCLAKVGPQLVALEALLIRPGMAIVAAIIRDPLEAAAAVMREYDVTARDVIASGGTTTMDGVPDVKELMSQIAMSKQQCVLAVQMLATLAKVRA